MELSSVRWVSDLVDDPSYSYINQREMSSLEELTPQHIAAALGDDFQSTFSSGSHTSYPTFTSYGSAEGKTFSCSSVETSGADQTSTAVPDVSSPRILTFSSRPLVGGFAVSPPPPPPLRPKEEAGFSITRGSKRNYETMLAQGTKKVNGGARPPSQAQDHIIAERKRREKLSQKFIALSAIVPGLKKMDKASVLGDAIKYVKQLQERVVALEDQSTRRTVESAVLVRRSQLSLDDGISSSDENFDGPTAGTPLPEIEAKLCEKSVLVRVHCEKRKGVLSRLLDEIEKLHLTVVNTSSVPFANSALDITVTAQVEDGFSITVKDLVKHLNLACRQFI
ncbi:unnamed protein product [Spirodela intermedia]|uniref:Uncharacterized protein n=1 Tax=Spirodela intermedia TaxID=51605 RepID=A0A7I8K9Z8_SPIIN|nr:unnamed protein product [Spirodela intermedia]